MTKLALSVAAMLLASSSAFAGSDHFGTSTQATATTDNTYTASTREADMVRHDTQASMKSDAEEPGQGIWGR
ncbi:MULTISPECIES: DUF680 domain-containing protein [Mesorhizobium]|jgi:hypothetical protein|uniref:DUF680 domain-containing protein n=1 Tax=Mesorhizobium opportunistum (strain LMG 24607 / HAMBI 3007 / WSM2075) TaxID=536019 RepID=F7YAK4_MESOW|nr:MULTISPECIES: DUF680 domain-containing protein [Mesorhizobium]AEH87682.1 protein of unknown function DUF680 [Mesorhizobium opportunistum WSM2075]TPN43639.1 DUF680 domain-containing protein [Mesorhizobium sp. B1-1-9]TPN44599.1 DUF680 domain-containing protein [Mesorhizobium sp. B1-1-7]